MSRKVTGIFGLLVVLCVLVAIRNPQFLSVGNIQNMARLIGTFRIFSIGVGVVIITGGIDLSVGSKFSLLGILLSMMLTEWRWSGVVAFGVVIGLGAVMGLVHGLLITRLSLQPFIVTLCGLLLYR